MEIASMLSLDGQHDETTPPVAGGPEAGPGHQYPTRHSLNYNGVADGRPLESLGGSPSALQSPGGSALKNVSFELSLDGSPNVRGRLPMRVQIFPHDTTESIVTTVKNFYGLYDSDDQGVSFEDVHGNDLTASYHNLTNNMTVYVRVRPGPPRPTDIVEQWNPLTGSPLRLAALNESASMLPQPAQILNNGQPPSRPGSRISRKQSLSPKLSQTKIGPAPKARSRSGIKSQGSSFEAGPDELNSDHHNGYCSSDGGAGSVTSSRKARSEQLATAEISVDNIVEGGRRQKAKFESSELPLFVPPQVPAPNSISSISPQRRPNPVTDIPLPFVRPLPQSLILQPPGQHVPMLGASDQAASAPPTVSPFTIPPVPAHGHRLRDRTSGASLSTRSSLGSTNRFYGSNILPTPDPTIASCISDEDVALQLMRLGDASNFSHGRTSTSTLDDGFSGKAEGASSDTSNGESDADDSDASDDMNHPAGDLVGPPAKKQRRYSENGEMRHDEYPPSGNDTDMTPDARFFESGRASSMDKTKPRSLKIKKVRATGLTLKTPKHLTGPKKPKVGMSPAGMQEPMSPSSLPPSRKASVSTINFQHQLQDDEEDLSSKPRCQRCRKSKKGCDRQRPCQRCKDAGIGIEGCISEDEGNGRKGRYGRHMGVAIKKLVESPLLDSESEAAGAILSGMVTGDFSAGQNKKRKRV